MGTPPRPHALDAVPGAIEKALELEQEARAAAGLAAGSNRCVVVDVDSTMPPVRGRRFKMKELATWKRNPYSSAISCMGDWRWWRPGFPVVIVSAGEKMRGEWRPLGESVREQGANLILLGDDAPASRRPGDA